MSPALTGLKENPAGSKLKRGGSAMKKLEALDEAAKMWIWLYKHPAHDKKYYVTYVAKPEHPWKNDCPICEVVENSCLNCLIQLDEPHGTFCTDPESPFLKWKATTLDNPDHRTFYAGEIIALAEKAAKKLENV
jgi:hypothetical protein